MDTEYQELFALWTSYTTQGQMSNLRDFVECFLKTFHDLIGIDETSLKSVVTEGPYLSDLPQGLLEVVSHRINTCMEAADCLHGDSLREMGENIKIVTILCRNPANISMVSSTDIVTNVIAVMSTCLRQNFATFLDQSHESLLKQSLTALECLYDPHFFWRRRLNGHTELTTKKRYDHSAVLHPEVIPLVYECFQHSPHTPIHSRILHLFASIMAGSQKNALHAISPATLEVILSILAPQQSDAVPDVTVSEVALQCLTLMVHRMTLVPHEKRQIDLSSIIVGYVDCLGKHLENTDSFRIHTLVSLINAICDILDCPHNGNLQILFSESGIFGQLLQSLSSYKESSPHTHEAGSPDSLPVSILKALNSLIRHSVINEKIFSQTIGYPKLVDILKSLGEPSEELLVSLLDLVIADDFCTSKRLRIVNTELLSAILAWFPVIESRDTSHWLSDCLLRLCRHSNHNCMEACRAGVVAQILTIFSKTDTLPGATMDKLLSLLELLGTVSLTKEDVRLIIGLIRTKCETRQTIVSCKLLHALSSMTLRRSSFTPSHYIDIQHSNDGVYFWNEISKLPGSAFTFHAWVRLDTDLPLDNHRRQLYCLRTNSRMGFEAFFTSACELVVGVFNKKEYSYAVCLNCDFTDQKWHMVDIVHWGGRRPLAQSQMVAFVDGIECTRANMKYPSTSQPIASCHIGNPGNHMALDTDADHDVATENPQEKAEISPSRSSRARSFISDLLQTTKIKHSSRRSVPVTNEVLCSTTPSPLQASVDLSGPIVPLIGQIACAFILGDGINQQQVAELYARGAGGTIWSRDGDLSDLSSKMILHISARACYDGICPDLSLCLPHGIVEGRVFTSYDIKDSINALGGIQILLPLIDNSGAWSRAEVDCSSSETSPMSENDALSDWEIIGSTAPFDKQFSTNVIAESLTLLRHLLAQSVDNRGIFLRMNYAATVGALLQKVDPGLIDISVLTSIQLLIEETASSSLDLLHSVYQYLLFDLRIWSRSQYTVQIGHLTYLSSIVVMDKDYFRQKFGVQYMLDIIRLFHRSTDSNDLPENEMQQIRSSLLRLVSHYMERDVTQKEVSALVNFLVSESIEQLLCEVIDVLHGLCEKARKHDQLYQLLSEGDTGALLYASLVDQRYTPMLKHKILKLISLLVNNERVSDKNRQRLRLVIPGFSGLASLMVASDCSLDMFNLLFAVATDPDNEPAVMAALSLLQLVPHLDADTKLEASRQLLSLLVRRPKARVIIAKQPAWQQTITDILIFKAKYMRGLSLKVEMTNIDDLKKSQLTGEDTRSCDEDIMESSEDSDESNLSSNSNQSNENRNMSLNLSDLLNDDIFSSNFQTPVTPIYQTAFEYLHMSSTELTSSQMPRSSSSEEKIARKSASSTSLSSFSLVENGDQNSAADVSTTAEVMKRAMDVLKLQNIYGDAAADTGEELCQNILVAILLVMTGSLEDTTSVWRDEGQVFTCLTQLSMGYELIHPVTEVKRRLLEMMLHSCTIDVRSTTGQSATSCLAKAVMLIRIVHDFIQDCVHQNNTGNITEWLLEEIASLLEALDIWSAQGSSQWMDIVHLGLNILLEVSKLPDLKLCSIASVKLHTVLQNRSLASSAEACYLIGSLNDALLNAIRDGTENYQFLILVLRTLLNKSRLLLNFDETLPNLPSISEVPTFDTAFSTYCNTEEWKTFIDQMARPQIDHFVQVNLDSSIMAACWTEWGEAMMRGESMKQQAIAEGLMSFQKLILLPHKLRGEKEHKRCENVKTQFHNQNISVMRHWRETEAFLAGNRGVWCRAKREKDVEHWMMSEHEMFSRMRLKLKPNLNFDLHTEASQLRDNGFIGQDDTSEAITLAPPLDKMIRRTNVGDDMIGDEDWNLISAAMSSKEPQTSDKDKESWVFSEDCELITIIKVTKGRMEVTTKCIYFFDCSSDNENETADFRTQISDLQEIHFRRYRLRRTALEIFLTDRSNYFLNFEPKVRNKVYSRLLSLKPPRLIYYGTRSPRELLKSSGLTEKWVQRKISNFEYLMQLNTIAGRTYNDLSQYPVFPWILSDYESETLDLSEPGVYRDLSKPIGIILPHREAEVRDKFEEFSDPGGQFPRFHYGTHYSHPAGVLYYLLRLEPYTTLHIDLFDNKFDHADRQFQSIACLWQSCITNPVDVKELIPEFFFLPDFLTNDNNFDLGRLQFSNGAVGDVLLPPWASTPAEFIGLHRKALESEHVSANLHNWIDLIFGYKQQGEAAEEAVNVFPFYTYEGAVDIDDANDANTHFGQTPTQLLKDPHPQRMSSAEVVARSKTFSFILGLEQHIPFSPFYVKVMSDDDPIVFVYVPYDQQHSILNPDTSDSMVTVSRSGILGVHTWLPYDKNLSNFFTLDVDPCISNSRSVKRVCGPFRLGFDVNPNIFAVSRDAKLLFCGGHWDGSLQVYSLTKHEKLLHLMHHTDVVTCLAVDAFCLHLITGSRDTTCIVWKIDAEKGRSVALNSRPVHTLYGHDDEVTAVVISSELDLALSASKDRTVIIHTVRKGQYVQTLRPETCPSVSQCVHIPYLCLSKMGYIVVYTEVRDDERLAQIHTIHLYNINGKHLSSERHREGIDHMTVTEDYLIIGSKTGTLSVTSLIGLKHVASLPLKVPITALSVTKGNSHILAALADGKLIIVGIKRQPKLR